MKKPNLFLVGEPKSGTTTLHDMLNQHPEICMSLKKEIGYFSKDTSMSEKAYLGHFKHCHAHKYIGESTPTYMHDLKVAARIYDFNPKARIIMVFRNPVDYLISFHRQLIRNPSTNIPWSFKKALPHLRSKADYYEHAHQFYEVFPRNQIMILSYERLFKNPQKYYGKLLLWLDLKPYTPTITKRNVTPKGLWKYKIYNIGRKFYAKLDKIFKIKSIHEEEYWNKK